MKPVLKFWGVRGSTPCTGKEFQKYGGNTPCVSINFEDKVLVLDAGTGIRVLGNTLTQKQMENIKILFSHVHWDHTIGFPFFCPIFRENSKIDVYGCIDNMSIKDALNHQMMGPYFPKTIDKLSSKLNFFDIKKNDSFELFDGLLKIKTSPLNHPNGAVGYRIEGCGKVVAYISDHEHSDATFEAGILDLIKDADIMIYDSTYTDEEYPNFVGWGHSTPKIAAEFSKKGNVKDVYLFHHSPAHTDKFLDNVAKDLCKKYPSLHLSYEGLEIEL
ncbi:MAG: MBL fold metallo-hydrolase [Alphaproteobacteria bacterium]|nr:MBL fold metallo-hydrolase [Alphaproteobacteria bacterium]